MTIPADAGLIPRRADPLNAETAPDRLVASFLTPQPLFYVRNHGSIPALSDHHSIAIDGLVARSAAYTAAALRDAFPARTVVAAMQCAGNRRAHLQGVAATSGNPWDVGAIGNAEWTGVALADVLAAAEVAPDAAFVAATGADAVEVDGEVASFATSIALAKACDGDVLIAWAMNGEPLTPEHGAPLRLVVPGYAGVRSTKWLTRIEVRDTPCDAPIQARDYKLFPASVTGRHDADWAAGLTIEEMPLNAAICTPADGMQLPAGACTIRGYAIACGRPIARVELSVDGGRDWVQATLDRRPAHPWSWTQWHVTVPLPPGKHGLVVRAVDGTGQVQPERPEAVWNFAGYLCSSWHRIAIEVA